jgi:dTDP-4-dehydrorhamnose reductase
MKILVTGSDGQLGSSFKKIKTKFNHNLFFFDKSSMDILNLNQNDFKEFDFIINCAAYTQVDLAEINQEDAYDINCNALKKMSDISNNLDIPLIHFSTDYLFDSSKKNPVKESEDPKPKSIYAKSKLDGEKILKTKCNKFLIIRTSWVYSEFGNNFVKTIFNLGIKKKSLEVVDDQFSNPTYAPDISEGVMRIIELSSKEKFGKKIYHFSGDEVISWYQFSLKIQKFCKKSHINFADINPVSSKLYKKNTLADRPLYSALCTNKINNDFNICPSSLSRGLELTLKNLIK